MDLPAPHTVVQRATELFQLGFIRPALDIICIELKKRPDQGILWLLKATILHSQGQWQKALSAVEYASLIIPLTLGGELVLADCYSYLGKHELASFAYEHLLAEESLPADYYAGLYAGFKRAGKMQLALVACQKAVEVAPHNDEAYFGMAHSMSALASPPRHITSVLRKALELAPEKPQYRISLAIQLALTKRRQEAHRILSNGTPAILNSITCHCVARKLLELCAWAGDEQRCSQLGVILARLNSPAQPSTIDGGEQS